MSTPTKLPADHNEAEGAIVIPENEKLVRSNPAFIELMDDRRKLFRQVDTFEPVTDIHNTAGMAAAKTLRQQIVKNRTALDRLMGEEISKYHKAHKAACDMRRPLIAENEAAEAHLRDSEEFAIRYEASRKAELNAERSKLLAPWVTAEQMSTFNLAEMSEDTFTNTLVGMKAAYAARELEAQRVLQEQRRAQEADRLAREEAEKALAVERAQRAEEQRLHNEQQAKLAQERQMEEALRQAEIAQAREAAAKREAEAAALLAEERALAEAARKEAEAAALAERTRLEAIAAEERRQREAVEQAQREKEAAERKKAAEEEAERKKAELAPDKQKLKDFIEKVYILMENAPTVHNEAELLWDTLESKMSDLLQEALKQIESL